MPSPSDLARSLIVVHGFHHQRDDGVDQAARLLRIQVLDQRGRAGHVRKQGGDRFALAAGVGALGFHGGTLGTDALGQVRWGVENWRR